MRHLSALLNTALTTFLLVSAFLVNTTSPSIGNTVTETGSFSTTSIPEYDPWVDLNNDGKIDIRDIAMVAKRFGAVSPPPHFNATAAIQYDSGWMDITNKAGQYINIDHNLNSTNVIVDITGKTTINGGTHQRHLGLTSYTLGWDMTYGGVTEEKALSMAHTSDGGYLIGGYTMALGNRDIWAVKTDERGFVEWNKTWGGSGIDWSYSVQQANDGGYVFAGLTYSFGHGNGDFWLIKTDSKGNMQWNKTYGSAEREEVCECVALTDDDGYILSGQTHIGYADWDAWVVKADSEGNEQWNKTYRRGPREDFGWWILPTTDGGYALGGATYSNTAGLSDFWLVKTDQNGTIEWEKTYGDGDYDDAHWAIQTKDAGYALIGSSGYTEETKDVWFVKTNETGDKQWDRPYGGSQSDIGRTVIQTPDEGYAIIGETASFGTGGPDAWLIKTDAAGRVQWNRTYGGKSDDQAYYGVQTGDGGFVLAGWTESSGAGLSDFWLIKTETEFGLAWTDSTANSITLYRGATDAYWNFVRVRIWKIKELP